MINKETIELIKQFEGCKLEAYLCPAYVWTIGYGHTRGVQRGDVITQQEADEMLLADLAQFERSVKGMVLVPLTDNQLGALVSFAFNVGKTALKNSTLLQRLNNKDYAGAANEFLKWNKATVNGVTKRREAERLLFLRLDGD